MEASDGRVVCEIGIAMAVEKLLREGYAVAVPLVDDGYDLLAFSERRYWRIQVKSSGARSKNRSRIRITNGRNRLGRYCPKHVDALVCVNIRTRQIMCVPVSAVGTSAWLNWSDAHRWSDFGILFRIKTQRC